MVLIILYRNRDEDKEVGSLLMHTIQILLSWENKVLHITGLKTIFTHEL